MSASAKMTAPVEIPSRKRKASCGGHSSVLVGSRAKNNKCEYLLRNSWGTNFGDWTSNWECFCEQRKAQKTTVSGNTYTTTYKVERFNCKKKTHQYQHGIKVLGCWVNEDALANNISEASWVD